MAITEDPVPNSGQELQSFDVPTQEPTRVFHQAERWNHPRSNILKTAATYWSFLVMGMNDAAYGVSCFTTCRLIDHY
jgi:hypothetical protein